VSTFFCVVLCCMWVEALCQADLLSKESYQLPNRFIQFQKIHSVPEQAKRLNT
jgi:hypothetical protein